MIFTFKLASLTKPYMKLLLKSREVKQWYTFAQITK